MRHLSNSFTFSRLHNFLDRLDHDFDISNKQDYSYLRKALKLSSRKLDETDFMLFDGEWWQENRLDEIKIEYHERFHNRKNIGFLQEADLKGITEQFFGDVPTTRTHPLSFDLEMDSDDNSIMEENNKESKIIEYAAYYLKAIFTSAIKNEFIEIGQVPSADENYLGWEDTEKYYIFKKAAWGWIEKLSSKENYTINFKHGDILELLISRGMVEFEEEANGRKRADVNATLYPNYKKRVIHFIKLKIKEYFEPITNG